MMRMLCLILMLNLAITSEGQTNNPFLKLQFDKVVFYDFELVGERRDFLIDDNGKYVHKVIKKVDLDTATIKALNSRLGNKKSYGAVTAFCFDPHCGFVYFLKGKPVAQVLICVGCNRLGSSIEIPAQKQGKNGEGENVYYVLNGMSKIFRDFLNRLLVKNKFSNQITPGSDFDR